MSGSLNLQEFVEQMDLMDMADEWSCFVNRVTGEIVTLETRYLAMVEEEEISTPLFGVEEREQIQLAEVVLENWENMILFPDKREWNEYGMMVDFSEAYPDGHVRECLCVAVSGRGAFRRFKDTLVRFDAEDRWYTFRDEKMLEFARNWCEENHEPCNLEETR